MRFPQLREDFIHGVQITANAAVVTGFGTAPGKGNGDSLGMDIQPDMDYRFAHGVLVFWFNI